MKFRQYFFESEYQGEHEAPGSDEAPMWNLSGTYPDDIYGSDGARLYGDNRGDSMDYESIAIIQRLRGRPDRQVKIYRAVPRTITPYEKIEKLENDKRYILKTGKIPPDIQGFSNSSQYFSVIDDKIAELKKLPPVEDKKYGINSGDWVTINRKYAVDHGKSNLKNAYRILSKTVRAKDLFTDGNSIHEWGYVPQ